MPFVTFVFIYIFFIFTKILTLGHAGQLISTDRWTDRQARVNGYRCTHADVSLVVHTWTRAHARTHRHTHTHTHTHTHAQGTHTRTHVKVYTMVIWVSGVCL